MAKHRMRTAARNDAAFFAWRVALLGRSNIAIAGSRSVSPTPLPRARMPVLMFHGLEDQARRPAGLNNTWDWLDKALVTIPSAGHFVQQDAAELASTTMRNWLLQRRH